MIGFQIKPIKPSLNQNSLQRERNGYAFDRVEQDVQGGKRIEREVDAAPTCSRSDAGERN